MAQRIELRIGESDSELVIHVEAPALLPEGSMTLEARIEDGVLELRVPKRPVHVPGFHPEASPV